MLRLEKLVKRYPTGDQALKGIDLEVPGGQVMALIGPSGAGPAGSYSATRTSLGWGAAACAGRAGAWA
jgi:ABC-type transport system involved in cytochrome bd biosynthesis fused ATPase/permease subunit